KWRVKHDKSAGTFRSVGANELFRRPDLGEGVRRADDLARGSRVRGMAGCVNDHEGRARPDAFELPRVGDGSLTVELAIDQAARDVREDPGVSEQHSVL